MINNTTLNNPRLEDLFRNLPIKTDAYKKAHLYADIAAELAGRRVEVYGYLIGPRLANEAVVHDVYLSHCQVVSPTRCSVSQEGVFTTSENVRQQGNKIMGWWHSHKGLDLEYHSLEDDENFGNLKYAFFTNNKMTIETQTTRLGKPPYRTEVVNNEIKIMGSGLPPTLLTIKLNQNPEFREFAVQDLVYDSSLAISFAYSLILNDDFSRPYCEIAVQADGKIKILKGVPIHPIPEDEKRALDVDLLRKEVIERVTFVGISRPSPTYIKIKPPQREVLEDRIRGFVVRNEEKINAVLSGVLVSYAESQKGLMQEGLIDIKNARKMCDVYSYLSRTRGEYDSVQAVPHPRISDELSTLVEEIIKQIRQIADRQVTLLLDYLAQNENLRKMITKGRSHDDARGRKSKTLRRQLEELEKTYTTNRSLLELWQPIKTNQDDKSGPKS